MKSNFQMKSKTFLSAAFIAVTAFTSCSDAPKGDTAAITDKQETAAVTGQTFTVDTTESSVYFNGHGVGKNHPGTFKLTGGNVAIADDKISGGEFTINIASMEMEEKGDMFENKLRPHLLSGDFFDAAKFGTAKFEITGVEPYNAAGSDTSIIAGANFNVSGNLTIKDVTKNITFPAKIDLDGNTLKAKANFNIDRRQWNMNYGNDKSLGDKFISETVNLKLDLQAKQ